MEGRIKWFHAGRGFGYITTDADGEFSFALTELRGASPAAGLAVVFERSGATRARDVRPAEDPAIYTVANFLTAMDAAVRMRHPSVTVEGEVASVRPFNSMLFFELKEEGAKLTCFIKKDLVPDLEEGTRIRATGEPNVSAKNAELRLRARSIEFAGEGALKRAVELLRLRLEEEGLFAPERKRELPAYPSSIGLITSFGCDGDMDFRTKLAQRWPHASVHLAHVAVQGAPAPEQVAAALAYFNQSAPPVDVIAIVRGGGSADDLQAFNTERVVRAIIASRVPVIVGVGHENDTTLADLAADVRAMTPTDAALRIAPDRVVLDEQLVELRDHLTDAMLEQIADISRSLVRQAAVMEQRIAAPMEHLRAAEVIIVRAMLSSLAANRAQLDRRLEMIEGQQARQVATVATRIETLTSLVNALAPQSVLRRGFAIVSRADGTVRAAASLRVSDEVKIRFDDGTVGATIEEL